MPVEGGSNIWNRKYNPLPPRPKSGPVVYGEYSYDGSDARKFRIVKNCDSPLGNVELFRKSVSMDRRIPGGGELFSVAVQSVSVAEHPYIHAPTG